MTGLIAEYDAPQLNCLGSIGELTAQGQGNANGKGGDCTDGASEIVSICDDVDGGIS